MDRLAHRAVTAEDVARFNEDGAICIRNVFDQDWCKRMNAAVERLLHDPGGRAREATKAGDPGRFHMNVFMWRWDPDFRDFALNSPLPELGATLRGLRAHPIAGRVTETALGLMRDLFASRRGPAIAMAQRSLALAIDADEISAVCIAFMAAALDAAR